MMDTPRLLAVVVTDFQKTGIGTRSRVADDFAGKPVLCQVISRLLQADGIIEVALLTNDPEKAIQLLGPEDRVRILPLMPRSAAIDARVRIGRAWNLLAWRGGAGQWTAFDEEYHPAAIARAAASAFEGKGAEHVLVVHSHAVFLDPSLTGALIHHHLHKNHEMRVTYTPAAPGLSGLVLRADIVQEMGEKNVMPWQLLAYDPKNPSFDTLIREACMQVDPALSKIPNRFCVDTQRSWDICKELAQKKFASLSELCLEAARGVASGVTDLSRVHAWPRELEIELTAKRFTDPPGALPAGIANGRVELDAAHWMGWLARQGDLATSCDDLLVTLGGDGDPLCFAGMRDVLRGVRAAGAISICLQTDLAGGDMDALLAAISDGLVDIVTVTLYGHTAETYARVAGKNLHGQVLKNMQRLAEVTSARGGVPMVVPRLLKVRETIPEMEAFFDFWIERCGWAVIDGPTDRAGAVPFGAVVDMAPPKRKACRRLWERMLIRCDGSAAACDQDIYGRLAVGNIEKFSIPEMWVALQGLRDKHAAGKWNEIDPCKNCREWHRP